MSIERAAAAAGPIPEGKEAQLRRATKDLEGVFVAELLKAMRETVPEGGLTDGGMGEDMFTSMLDQHLAPLAGEQWHRGIGDALYRQLHEALAAQSHPEGGGE